VQDNPISDNKSIIFLFFFLVIARRNYGGGGHHRAPTMNDLPTPGGDFFMQEAVRQRGHNMVLGLGIVMFASTIYFVSPDDTTNPQRDPLTKFFDLFQTMESKIIHLNYSPPDTYE
jgi:Deltamethrin resistance